MRKPRDRLVVNGCDDAPVSRKPLQERIQLDDAFRIEMRLGFVEYDEFGVAYERSREHDPSRLTS